ncbi:ATP phosphoribosyltransferase regulatory subunit [Desertibacillus haloalkaliphilus]|uniref:ATP phosphoribosyltransferase regulatory subunit n=1 Tax=Desertibacillus haloalkaliphilus TaxID=1328930 RepID=UPI001C273B75|nr:ATP phosphoribosyltransferase regulatory subunit [Desertibacillus haloalkaliphilus]MBU8906722.1 ATP phosphoribosyltransferase regulatory subunit [Desertibacillus haloalkaliphilus]
MSKPFMFEKPLGMRDTLPQLYETKKRIREQMEAETSRWGYRTIETPTLEFYDTVGGASAILDQQLFKLLDQQGNTLVLRPDMTAPIARLAASSLKNEAYPLRLSYHTNLFRAQQREGGKPAEFEQIGVELVGDGTASADGEVIALMISALKQAGLKDFQVAIGHIGYVNALLLDVVGNEERANVLRRYLYEKNYVGYRQHVKSLPLSSIDQGRLLSLLQLRGGVEKIADAKELVHNGEGEKALAELTQLWDVLECYGVTEHLKIDLNLVMHMSYYTGVVFEGYGSRLGVPLASGGRYDELLEKFNRPAQATGFGVRLDLLVEALGKAEDIKPQTCVVFSKERLADAIEVATEKRNKDEAVVLQDLAGVNDVDALSEQFDDVIYCIGKAKKEGTPAK